MSAGNLPIMLRSMRLPTIAREYESAVQRAEAENWGYQRFLGYLFEAEANDRLQRKIERQLKESNLPKSKTLELLDETRLPEKIRRQIPTLLEADFVRRRHLPLRSRPGPPRPLDSRVPVGWEKLHLRMRRTQRTLHRPAGFSPRHEDSIICHA